MNGTVAMEKARSLHDFALSQGAPLNEFVLALTDEEGLELLGPLERGDLGHFADQELLLADIAEARAKHDPWPVLGNFTLLGLSIERARDVLQ